MEKRDRSVNPMSQDEDVKILLQRRKELGEQIYKLQKEYNAIGNLIMKMHSQYDKIDALEIRIEHLETGKPEEDIEMGW